MLFLKKLKNKPAIWFLINFAGLFIFWTIIYEFWVKPNDFIDSFVVQNTIDMASSLLSFLGFENYNEGRNLTIVGTQGVWIGNPCNGIDLFALFGIFILTFPKTNNKYKIPFIVFGILIIHLANSSRITALSIIQYYNASLLAFNHTYTFTILVYAVIIGLWYLWIQKFRLKRK